MTPYETLVLVLESLGADIRAWGVAWARAAPAIAIVPAFGLRAVAAPVRIALGLAIAIGIAPALKPLTNSELPWQVLLLVEAARGLPVAVGAAAALWTATMVGGLVDDLRGGRDTTSLPIVEPSTTPMAALLSMLSAIVFLESGGPARIAAALADPSLEVLAPVGRLGHLLTSSISVAIAVAAPVVVATIVVEVAGALVSRAASPAFLQVVVAPLRSIAVLGVLALMLDRMQGLLAL